MFHRIWFTFILIVGFVERGLCEDEKFMAGFSAGAESCKDFSNDNFKTDNMKLAPMDSDDEDGAGLMCIEGSLEICTVIDEGVMINIDIEKETDQGSEPMMSVAMDLCECIKDEDAPWKSLFVAMGIDSCPIETGTYEVKDMIVNLSFADPILTRDYVGDYGCTVKLADQRKNSLSCHNLGLCIVEM